MVQDTLADVFATKAVATTNARSTAVLLATVYAQWKQKQMVQLVDQLAAADAYGCGL